MYENITKPLKISQELKKKIEFICHFANVKYELIEGNVLSINNTNIAYVKPHILKVKENDYLLFENSDYVFKNGYKEKIRLTDLESELKALTLK